MEEKKEQAQNEVKKSKKTLVIAIIIAIIVVGAIIAFVFVGGIFETKDKPKDTETKEIKKGENQTPPEKLPAANTEELKQTVAKAEVKEVTKDKIIFNTDAKIEVGKKSSSMDLLRTKILRIF